MHPVLEEHHAIHGTAGRSLAEEYGLKVYLCPQHHRTGPGAVHKNKAIDRAIQKAAQREFEKIYGHARWMAEMKINYLEEMT